MNEKSLLGHFRNYLGSAIASKLIAFLSVVVYSRLMSIEDYGTVSIFTAYIWILAIIFSGNLYTSIGRYIYLEKGDFDSFFTTAMTVMGVISAASIAVITIWINQFEKIFALNSLAIMILTVVVIAAVMESIFTQIAIYMKQSDLLFKLLTFKSLGSFLLCIALILLMDERKYLALMFSELISGSILVIVVFYKLKNHFKLRFMFEHLKYMFSYSVPLIPYMISLTLISQSDRLMINYFFSEREAGLYSLVYNVGIAPVLIATALLNAWNPSYHKYMNNHEYDKVSVQTEHIFNLLFLIAIIGVVIGKEASMLILDKKYYSALDMFPIISIGALGSCMWQIWVRNITYVHKTYIMSILALIGLALNAGLNYVLFPLYGYTVAAWTTVASYMLMGFASIVITNLVVKHCRVTLTDKLIKVSAIIVLYFLLKELPVSFTFGLAFKLLLMAAIIFFYRNTILEFGKIVR